MGGNYSCYRKILISLNVKIVKLEQNYRSTQVILDAANHVIANNIERKRKKLWSDKKEGQLIKIQLAENEIEEATFSNGKVFFGV